MVSYFFDHMKKSLHGEMQWSRAQGDGTGFDDEDAVTVGTFSCRWEENMQVIKNLKGEETVSNGHVFTQAFTEVDGEVIRIQPNDTLTNAYGNTLSCIRVEHKQDTEGNYTHTEVYL